MAHAGGSVWLKLQLLLSLCHVVIAAPSAGDAQQVIRPAASHEPQVLQRKLQGRFLHITDFHPDKFYEAHTSTDVACHRGKGLAGAYGAETTDCDSPYSLVNATFDWIEANIKDQVDFVVWTGDSARHDSDEKHPRNAAQVLKSNRIIANKFVDSFSSSSGRLSLPVVPTFGNNDFLPHNIMYPGPNKWLLAYSDIWKRFIPEEQRHSFEFGGWFYVEVIPHKLAVFSLNTMFFFDRNAAVDGCADPSEPGYKHMEWLRVQLQRLREKGMKAILMGHVPPARTDSKQNWDETCWQRYTLWLQKYRDVVVGSLYGHMNIDHFLLQDTKEINLNIDAADMQVRDSLDEKLSVSSKGDYLQELRSTWSDLPGSAARALDEDDNEDASSLTKGKKGKKGKGKKKYKKIGGKYAERYQLSLISPSIVPNYFPTLRIIEYNITGMEETPLWEDLFNVLEDSAPTVEPESWDDEDEDNVRQELKRDVEIEKKRRGKKGKKGKKGKGKKGKKDPNLIIPKDPSKDSVPGPAYYPQPFTLTGYTQYFANLTHINNDLDDVGLDELESQHKKPRPRAFKFEVEYSTFDDKIYKLKDLTVRSYLKLAYRIGKQMKGKSQEMDVWDEDFEDDDDLDEGGYDDLDDESEADHTENEAKTEGKKGKKHKKKGKKNKTWLHFLEQAFVSTVAKEELEDM